MTSLRHLVVLLGLLGLSWSPVHILAYDVHQSHQANRRRHSIAVFGINENRPVSYSELRATKQDSTKGADPLIKAPWYVVEAFGKVFGSPATGNESAQSTDQPPSSVEETFRRIRTDNEREYFLSGDLDLLIYAEDCTFSDPFVSFQGRDRFVANLKNLSAFITNYSAKPLSYNVDGNSVTTKFMVKLQLNLPWRPVLAWRWGVRCEIDPDICLIRLHEESVSTIMVMLIFIAVLTLKIRSENFLTRANLLNPSGTLIHGTVSSRSFGKQLSRCSYSHRFQVVNVSGTFIHHIINVPNSPLFPRRNPIDHRLRVFSRHH